MTNIKQTITEMTCKETGGAKYKFHSFVFHRQVETWPSSTSALTYCAVNFEMESEEGGKAPSHSSDQSGRCTA